MPCWLHDLSPFLWEIRPGIGLRWYGLSYALGFAIAWLLLRFLADRGYSPIPKRHAGDAIVVTAISVVVCGRLGYVLLYNPALLAEFDGSFPYWGLLKVHQGGMASHGGIVGAIVGAYLVSRGFKQDDGTRIGRAPLWRILDTFCLITPPGLALGRIANFINGELLGKIVARAGEPAPWWAVKFPQEVIERPQELSREQLEGLSRALGLARIPTTGEEFRQFEALYARLLHQLQDGSHEARRILEPLINARHPSQIYQAIGEGLVVGLVVWLVARRPRKPAIVSASFAIVYGVQRIVTEFWRLPDAHLASPRMLGLSRGQWLSVLMVLAGVALLVWASRRDVEPAPGWAGSARDEQTDPASA